LPFKNKAKTNQSISHSKRIYTEPCLRSALPDTDLDRSPEQLEFRQHNGPLPAFTASAARLADPVSAAGSPTGSCSGHQVHIVPRFSPLPDRSVHRLHGVSAEQPLGVRRPRAPLLRDTTHSLAVWSRPIWSRHIWSRPADSVAVWSRPIWSRPI